MKTLMTIFTGLILTLFTTGFTNFNSKSSDSEKIEVYFSKKLEFNDLVKMKLDLSQQQIILNYQSMEFDSQNKLKSIGFSVISEGKYCGSGKTGNLIKEYGFSIDKSPHAEIYFKVGLTR